MPPFKLKNPSSSRRRKPRVKKKEENLQRRVANYLKRNYPNVIFISDAAGVRLTVGQSKLMKALNSDKGRPDMIVLYPSRGYHALCMELKQEGTVIYSKDGTLRKQPVLKKIKTKYGTRIVRYNHLVNQATRLAELNRLGYLGRFVIGYDAAVRLIDGYMEKPQNETLF